MLYLSKPNGTHAIFPSRMSQGAYTIHKLEPGREYMMGPSWESIVGERDFLPAAKKFADEIDETTGR